MFLLISSAEKLSFFWLKFEKKKMYKKNKWLEMMIDDR